MRAAWPAHSNHAVTSDTKLASGRLKQRLDLGGGVAGERLFFSIGTNDLIGYTMCADRGNDTISNLYQVYYPAVLRSLKNIIESGVKAGIMVGMCGEAAADPLLEPLLISWGLEEFSMSAPSILRARKTISQWTKAECDELAEKALACNTAAEVKALLESAAR